MQSELPIWVRATLDDLSDLDFEAPIATLHTADCHELGDQFHKAVNPGESGGPRAETGTARVLSMLAAVTQMMLKPDQPGEPFGALWMMDGKRSAIAADFRGGAEPVLALMAERTEHPVLRARLADLSWFLARKRQDLGRIAVAA